MLGIQFQAAQAGRDRQGFTQVRLGQQQGDTAVLEHVAQAVLRVFRVQRHIGATGLHDAQQADDHLQAALHGDAHQHIRAHAQFAQLVCQLVGPAIQFGVSQGLLAKGQRRSVRGGGHLGLDQLMNAGFARVIRLRGIPALHDLLPLTIIQQWQLSDSLTRVGDDAMQQVQPVPRHLLDGRGIEQVGCKGKRGADALLMLEAVQREVELRRMHVPLQALHLQARQAAALALAPGLVVVHHLEQRAVAQAALRLQGIDQLFEWQVLMHLRAQGALPHLCQQLAESQLRVEFGAHHLGVDEKADQPLGLHAVTVGDGHAHTHVGLPGVAVQQHLETRQQQHERCRPLVLRQLFE
ncbi:hypothetical protein D3C81_575490 [compost metagenome]